MDAAGVRLLPDTFKPLFETPVRDTCVCFGPDGTYFETEEAYAVLRLNAECRSRQTGKGLFGTEEEVPKHVVCMSIVQIMRTRSIVCVAEGARRVASGSNLLRGPVSNLCPASVLQVHPDCTVFLDAECASVFWRRIGSGVRARQDEEEDG